MAEVPTRAPVSDAQVEEFLNRFIYGLYARGSRPITYDAEIGPIISDAGLADAILRAPDKFHKNFSWIAALGRNRLSADGDEWRRRRDLTQPAYARAGTLRNRPIIAAAYAQALAACEEISPQGIQRALLTASIRIFFQAFGCTVAAERLLIFCDRVRRVLKRLQYHSWIDPSTAEQSALHADAQALLRQFENEVVRSPRLMKVLQDMQARGESIAGFSVVEEFMMNFFAGFETTAATLSFAIDRLGIDARVQQRLLGELDHDECPYLECFINETMRYFPAIPFVIRQAASDITIGGTAFRQKQLLLLSIIGVHHDPKSWKEPEIFDCSRAEFMNGTYDRRAFIPFLSGPRMCGGVKLARLELTEGLKAFIRRFKVERNGDEIRFDYGLALRPNSWELVKISRRE